MNHFGFSKVWTTSNEFSKLFIANDSKITGENMTMVRITKLRIFTITKWKATTIDTHDTVTYGSGLPFCDCENSEFCDPNHGHILTGNLRIIGNEKLRKLVARGPNFREAKMIHGVIVKLKLRLVLRHI
jgi:hypothetical protein